MLMKEINENEKLERFNISKRVKELQDNDICPSCYNFKYKDLYQDYSNRLLHED